ncbi:hypothetical protein LSTR_LSTR010361 [Laodelphax striatellus]|uniref:Uncharacterized protein n=1 Tax=Laodelphax striatellus TaxID=195883 RepID=A0A482WK04_LAOST|nr:hypothetical protein LSTR_LSTR010361 [Laodelphax striatellus]
MNYNNKFYYAPKITHVVKKKGAKADAAEEEDDPSLNTMKLIIEADTEAKGDTAVQISRPNVIRVKCNVVSGSYSNGVKDHVIYEFYPNVDPGYKIVVTVQNVIYLPVDAKQIGNITLEVVDENGRLINNRGEEINITLHLRQRK